MEYQHSRVIDPSEYMSDGLEGLCDGIPLREHNDPIREDIGTVRAQEDWNRLVQPLDHYKGGMAARFNLMSIAVPECIPERLEIICYANEFAFLHDDITDNVDQKQVSFCGFFSFVCHHVLIHRKGDIENDAMLEALREGAQNGAIQFKDSGKNQIQMQMLQEMIAIDRERAMTTTRAWAKFVQLAAGRQNDTTFANLEEYIPYRMLDIGEMFWFGIVTFGMAITIPEEEMETCEQLMRPAWIVLGLQNDLFSWEKEYASATRMGLSNVANAIWVLMKEHSIDVESAKELCRGMIKENVTEYQHICQVNKDNTGLSLDLRRYMEAMQYSLSGNAVWSFICPRYHPKATFNRYQLAMMEKGLVNALKPRGEINGTMTGGVNGQVDSTFPVSNGSGFQTELGDPSQQNGCGTD